MRSKTDIFPYNYSKKSWQASALPRPFPLFYRKTAHFGVLRSFEIQIFLHSGRRWPQKYWVYFQDSGGCYGGKDVFKTV